MRWLTAALEWQSRAVVTRHLRVYLRNWHTAFLPPALEPVTMLIAFGVGLGGYVASLPWYGREVSYLTYADRWQGVRLKNHVPNVLDFTSFRPREMATE